MFQEDSLENIERVINDAQFYLTQRELDPSIDLTEIYQEVVKAINTSHEFEMMRENVILHLLRIQMYPYFNRHVEAIVILTRLIEKTPSIPLFRWYRAKVYYSNNQLSEAEADLLHLLNPDIDDAIFLKAILLYDDIQKKTGSDYKETQASQETSHAHSPDILFSPVDQPSPLFPTL